MIKKTSLLVLLAFITLTGMAQKKSFTTDDLFGYSHQPKNIFTTWWGDECVRLDVEECALYSFKNENFTQLFSLAQLNKWLEECEAEKVTSCQYLSFPEASKTEVLLKSRKENILLNWTTGKIVWRQSRNLKGANQDWHTLSRHEAFTVGGNLFVTTADGKQLTLSTDGSREIVYGQSVHRDEFGIHKGTFWSPKGNLLAFYRMDQSMVTDYPQVDISTRSATYQPDKYPMAGQTSHKVTVGVFNPTTERTIWLDAGDPTDRYFTNISWSPDEKTVYIIELNRGQDHAQLVGYNAETGKRIGLLYEEKHPKYVEPLHGLTFLPWDESKFIYQSQRDGYNHLYLVDLKKSGTNTWKNGADGATYFDKYATEPLTQGKFVVMQLLGFNLKSKSVIIKSNESNPIQHTIYSVNVARKKRTLLGAADGVHYASLSANGSYLIDQYSSPTIIRRIDLVSTQTGKQINLLNAEDPWNDFKQPEISCGTLKAADESTDLYYRMVKPIDFDSTKKYPTVVYVYGGPHAHNVNASRNYLARPWEIYMAQKGYLIFVLDNRGSQHRGLAFENCTFRQLGKIEAEDQMKGVEYLKSLPYVDDSRLGIHGWSYGGYMTISMMCTYPDVFKVGVSGGPVTDWKYYEVMYGERYMDTPEENPEGYAARSMPRMAKNLKGKLQIITGYNDSVCVQQHTLAFLRACIDAGVHADFFTYPGQGHNMVGKDRLHLHERITQYFEDYLK